MFVIMNKFYYTTFYSFGIRVASVLHKHLATATSCRDAIVPPCICTGRCHITKDSQGVSVKLTPRAHKGED